MLSALEACRMGVYSAKGKRIGRVEEVLFAPGSTRVVGFTVFRPRLWYLIDLKERYLALDRASISGGEVTAAASRDAWDGPAAKRLGFSWEDTVIWVGMPVRTVSGAKLGTVRDVRFDPTTGELSAMGLSGGVAADIAVGIRDLPASRVTGFNGEVIVVADEIAHSETTGGAAAVAGRGAAVGAKAVGDAAKTAVLYGRAAAKVASESEAGKKAMGWLKSVKDAVVDAMDDSEEK